MNIVLASSSPRRLDLLKQIGIVPELVYPPEINEIPLKRELPIDYAKRISIEKAKFVANLFADKIILSADTVAFCGRTIIDKAINEIQARKSLEVLSGRRHKVATSITLIKNDTIFNKIVVTSV
ncbi:MAG: Maf family protein, partial [Pseudomonadota bacterium]